MIYHVTYEADRWRTNKANATGYGYQCMTPVHADCSEETVYQQGQYLYVNGDEYQGDLFPYRPSMTENRNSFSDDSTPQDVLNTPNSDGTYLLHTNVTNIRTQARFCFFVFNGGTRPWTPDGIQETAADMNTGKADVYSLDGRLMRTAVENGETGSLPQGVYVLRYADGSSRKIAVK